MLFFTLEFGALSSHIISSIHLKAYEFKLIKLAGLINVPVAKFHAIKSRHQHEVEFLIKIENEFGMHFESIKAWLQALNDPKQSFFGAVSIQTQNNMLHMLAQLQASIARLFIKNKITEHLSKRPVLNMSQSLQEEMAHNCNTLAILSSSLSYRDLSNALSRFFASMVLNKESLIRIEAIQNCILEALGSTREAVLVRSRQMATPGYNMQFFGNDATYAQDNAPSTAKTSAP